jgi:hypothetical protein
MWMRKTGSIVALIGCLIGCTSQAAEDVATEQAELTASDILGTWYGHVDRSGALFKSITLSSNGRFEILFNDDPICAAEYDSCETGPEVKILGSYSLGPAPSQIAFVLDDPSLARADHWSFIFGLGPALVIRENPSPPAYRTMTLVFNNEAIKPAHQFTEYYRFANIQFVPGQSGKMYDYCLSREANRAGSCASGMTCNGGLADAPYHRSGTRLLSLLGRCGTTVGLSETCGATQPQWGNFKSCGAGLVCDYDGHASAVLGGVTGKCISAPAPGTTPSCNAGTCAAGQTCWENTFSTSCE